MTTGNTSEKPKESFWGAECHCNDLNRREFIVLAGLGATEAAREGVTHSSGIGLDAHLSERAP